MIFGSLNEIENYKEMPEIYAQLVELKKAYDTKEEKPVSKVTLNNKNYFVVFEGPTKHLESPRLEVHHKAIDIHVAPEGEEAIWYGDYANTAPDGDYIVERDVAFYTGSVNNVCYLQPGEFLLVFPEEVHSPMNSCHGCEKEKKAVGKIFIK